MRQHCKMHPTLYISIPWIQVFQYCFIWTADIAIEYLLWLSLSNFLEEKTKYETGKLQKN